jgi:alkaline phosphatase D
MSALGRFGASTAFWILWSGLAFANTPPPPKLTHGPLLGCGSDVVWVRTSAAATVVLEHGFSADFVGSITSPSIVTNVASDFTAHFRLANLPPDTLVYYRVWMNGALVTPAKRFRTPPPEDQLRTVRIAVFNDWARSKFPGLASSLSHQPHLVILGGDLPHSNPPNLGPMRRMYQETRSTASDLGRDIKTGLIDVAEQIPSCHMWDDHDYGGDNSDGTYKNKDQARQAYREYWPMASDPGPGTAIYQKLSYSGTVDVFLLDLRSERDPIRKAEGPDKSMMGAEQKQWFKDQLLTSNAPWKLVVTSVPFNPTAKKVGGWVTYMTERRELIDFVRSHGITGVVLASGDIHSGGGIDDGTNAGLTEVNCPRANEIFWQGMLGTWSEGMDKGGAVSPGFCAFVFTPQAAAIQTVGEEDVVRRSLTLPVGSP